MTAGALLLLTVLQATPSAPAQSDTLEVKPSSPDSGFGSPVQLYHHAEGGVVRVRSGLSHGTGFLIQRDGLGGLVVTNDHVLTGAPSVSVIVDSATRVPAQIIARERDEDLALLQFHPDACTGCRALPFVPFDKFESRVRAGMQVVALGYPLSQPLSITSGIVAAVRPGAIISDVNLSAGNSGGPLLSMSGRVVAVNTFRDPDEAGPGISGSLPVTRLEPLLEEAADTLPSLGLPENRQLPLMPDRHIQLDRLRYVADSVSLDEYQSRMKARDAGDFRVRLRTPVSHFVALRDYGVEVGVEERWHRQRQAGVREDQLFSAYEPYRAWIKYVGRITRPVVTVEATPTTSEKFGSVMGRALLGALGGVSGQAEYAFDGDVGRVRLYRNGQLVEPILGGERVHHFFVDNAVVELKEVVGQGYNVYPADIFRPDSTGSPPSIVLAILDLKEPEDRYEDRYELPAELVAQVWNDFVAVSEASQNGGAVTRADPERFDSLCDDPERWPDSWERHPWKHDEIPDWKQPELERENPVIPFCHSM